MSARSPEPEEILRLSSHRPWPVPEGAWLVRQSWYDVLFAHWPVDVTRLRALVPPELSLDEYDGRAWVGVVPFLVRDSKPHGLPGVPGATTFLEANVRTYVTVDGKPGVYFFSLDAASALAVLGARALFHLAYFEAEMEREHSGGWTRYRSRRRHDPAADLECSYRPAGPAMHAQPGTLDHFLIERYCLYTVNGSGSVLRANIHHAPWPVQPAEAAIQRAGVLDAIGLERPAVQPLVHYAVAQHVLVWSPERAN